MVTLLEVVALGMEEVEGLFIICFDSSPGYVEWDEECDKRRIILMFKWK